MDFVQEWFRHPEWWFKGDPSIDTYLRETYEHLLNTMNENTEDIYDLLKILVWDQLPRHIYRNQAAHHVIDYYLQKALCVVHKRFNDKRAMKYIENLCPQEVCFFLMPLRHTQSFACVTKATDYVWQRLETEKSSKGQAIFKRFLRASYQRMPIHDQESNIILFNTPQTSPFHDTASSRQELSFTPLPSADFILSLSGGVDSMVCSWILRQLYPSHKIIAVMINYANRDTSSEEVKFVQDWCQRQSIKLYIRHITEIHRPLCMKHEMREIYETYTRQVRYQTYRTVWTKEFQNNKSPPQVVMGHNKTDRFENILTNMTYKAKYENLCGMEFTQCTDNIVFYRPLLDNFKEDIIAFANTHDIPYLPCSTPAFSQRGKIRKNIVPVLKEWNSESINGFFEMANVLSDTFSVLTSNVDLFVRRFQKTDEDTYEIKRISLADIPLQKIFWKYIFIKLYGITVSMKSLDNFIVFLQRPRVHETSQYILHKRLCFKMKKFLENNEYNIRIMYKVR